MSSLRSSLQEHLERREFDEVLARAARDHRITRALVSLLYDPDELLRWRSVSMIGRIAARYPGLARPLVARLLWTLNDESGGIGWTSAPALGEIGRNAPDLLQGSVRVVVHYLEDPTLLPGVVWAIGRLADAFPGETREVVPDLLDRLRTAADPVLRGQTVRTLGEIGDPRADPPLRRLSGDDASARLYVGEEFVSREVRIWAEEALTKLERVRH